MAMDVNVIWIKQGVEQQRQLKMIDMSEIFEEFDIVTDGFWSEVVAEPEGNYPYNEHLMIDADNKTIEMDGEALRYDWYAIKEKILKLRKNGWRIYQIDTEILEKYPWLKESPPERKPGKGWHGESEKHSVKRKVGHIRKKYKQSQEVGEMVEK